jgi:hypothetical protein
VTFSGDAVNWSRAPYPRGEGSLTLTRGFGEMGHFKIGVEGAYQPIRRIGSATDANGMTTAINVDSAIWGVSGGARLEVGPARLGVSGFRGRGLGIGNAFQRTDATADDFAPGPNGSTYGLRTSTGVYGQVGAFLGSKVQIAAGFGMSIVDQLAADKANPNLSVIHTQTGISGAVYYHLSDSLVMGVDFFNFRASWYGAPIVDMNNQPTGTKLAGELQTLNFLNAGVTYHW